MSTADLPLLDVPPPPHLLRLRDLVARQSVTHDAWQPWFERYLTDLLRLHEQELHPNVPARTLTDAEFFHLLILAARLGATATLAALETVRPPEPPV